MNIYTRMYILFFKECKTYKILVERPLVLILVVVATIQMWKIPKNGALV